MGNIILVKTPTPNGFTINTTDLNKSSYPLTAEIKINGASVGLGSISTLLPFAVELFGVNEIELIMRASNSTKTSKLCHFHDPILYCNVIQHLSSLSKEELLKDGSSLLYWLLQNGIEDDGCACSCNNLKQIYANLLEIINPKICC